MSWLIVAVSAYFCSAIVALFDKYLLTELIPSHRVYAFYVGILGVLVSFLIPFVNFSVPGFGLIFLCLLSGALFIYSVSWFLRALQQFEASRVVPVIGGLTPIFVFGLTALTGDQIFNLKSGISFLLLILGSVLISLKKEKNITLKSFWISAISAFLFSLAFFSAKFVYLYLPFWSGFIWIRIGGGVAALFFLFSKEVKEEIFKKRETFRKKTAGIFILGQTFGVGSVILQNWAIALIPLGFLSFVNALEGTKYVFLLVFTAFLSLNFPQIIKEEMSWKIFFQKTVAILLIGAGLILLVFK